MIDKVLQRLNAIPTSYAAAKIHSAQIDQLLDFQYQPLENALNEKFKSESHSHSESEKQMWIGLDVHSMQTPYSEILEMIKVTQPKETDHWIDIGAAYGRMGITLAITRPRMRFTGYEIVNERAIEANRIYKKWNFQNAEVYALDLAAPNVLIPPADLYFIYDFGSKKDADCVLEKLRILALEKPIQVIARGRGIKNWIMMDYPWLSQTNPPTHFTHWSWFRS